MKITTQESLVAKVGFFGGDKPPQYQLDIMVELNAEEKQIIANAKARLTGVYSVEQSKLVEGDMLFTLEQYGKKSAKLQDFKIKYINLTDDITGPSRKEVDRSNEWQDVKLELLLDGFYSFIFRTSYNSHLFKEEIIKKLKELKEKFPKIEETTDALNTIHKRYTESKKSELEI